MPESHFPHSETLLQWIWENLLFNFTGLKTTCGKTLHITSQGKLNASDGPDFKQAILEIGDISWHGDVEIHTRAKNWFSHGHQNDKNYNSVVLHVVADRNYIPVKTENQSRPFTLNLLPYLPKEFYVFLKSFENSDNLPCASGLSFISETAFQQQIQKAHKEYFEKKSADFLSFYDPELVPSKAWKHALIISIFDGLGISHNREAMRKVASDLLRDMPSSTSAALQKALEIAGFGSLPSDISWNYKSSRPNNHPSKRIKQAAVLAFLILEEPFKHFLKTAHATELWDEWIRQLPVKQSNRLKILYGTVFLPALYMLGQLFAHFKLSETVFSEWLTLKTPVPRSLLSKFKALNLENNSYQHKLGSVYQLKSYCNNGNCPECLVLKKAILS